MLRRQLELESASPAEIDHASFCDLLRLAAEKGLIDEVEAWFEYRHMRSLTAHTYNQVKAQQVYQGTLKFMPDARKLLSRLESRHA